MNNHSKSRAGVTKLVTNPLMIRLMSICTWCGLDLDDAEEIVTLPVESPPEIARALEGYGPPILKFTLTSADSRMVVAIVPAPGSDARQDGISLLFATCSDACCTALRAAFDEEIRIGRLQLLTGPIRGTA